MPFKIANHGGRFLYVDQDNQLKEDTNYNMTRSPEDLASAGSVFALDDKNQIVSYETGKPVRLSDDSSTYPLILEKIDDGEYVIRTADRRKNHRYVFSGLERLRIEDEPDSMAMFSVFQQ